MRKLLYFFGAITGLTLVVAAFRRAERNDLYEDARNLRVRQLNQRGMLPHELDY